MSWRWRAACHDHPTDLFFPPRGRRDIVSAAKAVCRDCPVRADCLDFSMSFEEPLQGIYGGLTESERRRMR